MAARSIRSREAVDLLVLEPVRCVPWREAEDGRVVIDRPRPRGRGLRLVREAASWMMTPRRIRLDDLGSFAWRRLDGSTSVATIVGVLRQTFPDRMDQAEERLGAYLRMLRRYRLIDFRNLDG